MAEACHSFRRRSTRFPPNAGELYDRCAEFADKQAKADRLRLPPPKSDEPEYSEAHREDMKRRFNDLVAELVSGKNINPEYGKVPKGTKPEKPTVKRTVPGSFLDKWERDNGREYLNIRKAAE